MPSKTTFALVAVLAASVSALPTRGSYVDLVERGSGDATNVAAPASAVPVPAANAAVVPPTAAAPPVAKGGNTSPTNSGATAPNAAGNPPALHPHAHPKHHSHQHQLGVDGQTHPGQRTNRRRRPHHNNNKRLSAEGGTHPSQHKKPHHHHASNSANAASTPLSPAAPIAGAPVVPPSGAPTLSRREYYESLYVRGPGDHPHPHHHHHGHHPHGQHPHHHHHHPQTDQSAAAPPAPVPDAPAADPSSQPQRREYLERRGLLETLGLKARVSNLTVKQTEQMTKAKSVCGGLASKKDQHTCHKDVDKIIQLTKERNYDVEKFIKLSNHHDVFTSSDPSLTSSSTSHT